ncbi:hypothetical protein GA0115260_1011713 [Streptomyces sp. MnatMP-M27]|nr:hypothetical protein GA0115260_1011713 [Streptomyces sp. MnatMP-M27]
MYPLAGTLLGLGVPLRDELQMPVHLPQLPELPLRGRRVQVDAAKRRGQTKSFARGRREGSGMNRLSFPSDR